MFDDRTLICEGDPNDFIEIIRQKKGSMQIQLEKAEIERQLLAESQVMRDKNIEDSEESKGNGH